MVPSEAPEALGREVMLTTYVNANLYHNMITGRSVTGIILLINKTPFKWYSNKQSTVETATYGSEYTTACIAVDQIISNWRGVPIKHVTYVFGDNKSVVDNSSIPHTKLHKQHTAVSFHRIREAIASKILAFMRIKGQTNPADILCKH